MSGNGCHRDWVILPALDILILRFAITESSQHMILDIYIVVSSQASMTAQKCTFIHTARADLCLRDVIMRQEDQSCIEGS